jgi:hypothetical protein
VGAGVSDAKFSKNLYAFNEESQYREPHRGKAEGYSYSVIAKGREGNLVFNNYQTLNIYMEQVDPSKPFQLQGDLILLSIEIDDVANDSAGRKEGY